MELAQEDYGQLCIFRDLFQYDGVIEKFDKVNPSGATSHLTRMILHSAREMTMDLEKNFGIMQNKTHRLPPPNIQDPDLIMAYILGLLDGDGCVHINKNGICVLMYTSSSKAIVEWIYNRIEFLGLDRLRTKRTSILLANNAWHCVFNGRKALDFIKRARTFATKHNLPILARKWYSPKVEECLRLHEEKFGVIPEVGIESIADKPESTITFPNSSV